MIYLLVFKLQHYQESLYIFLIHYFLQWNLFIKYHRYFPINSISNLFGNLIKAKKNNQARRDEDQTQELKFIILLFTDHTREF